MTKEKQSTTKLRMPAEWEEQSGVQLTWPHAATDWAPHLEEITTVFIRLAQEIAQRELLLIVAPDTEAVKTTLASHLRPEELANIRFHRCDTDDTWARDHGTICLTGDEVCGETKEATLLDFRFNGWGEKFAAQKDNAITQSLYAAGRLCGRLERHDSFVLEGGSIESDGRGTIFTTSQCLLAPHRNQPLTRQQIDEKLRTALRADRIVWLDHGSLMGDDTDGHIDTIVRTAPNDTLLYVRCADREDEQYADFVALERQLQTLCTTDGRPYRLLPLPMPHAIREANERLPATYANFLVVNGAVLCPTYGQEATDREALRTISQAYPGRQVVGIDARAVILQHGSLHCLTMQFPRGILK